MLKKQGFRRIVDTSSIKVLNQEKLNWLKTMYLPLNL